MAKKLFVNLPVTDLNKSVEFFSALGFAFNPDFTDENATCMIVNDDAFVMLLVEGFFKTFTNKPIADAAAVTETILSVAVESRDAVDELIRAALTAGGTPAHEALDYGFMYNHSFHDPDGHLWEVFWMDPAGPPKDTGS